MSRMGLRGRGGCWGVCGGSMCVFFFQAEDGIRDLTVTGVQTCALPIYARVGGAEGRRAVRRRDGREPARVSAAPRRARGAGANRPSAARPATAHRGHGRSGERRVGEEWRSWWWPDHLKKKKSI